MHNLAQTQNILLLISNFTLTVGMLLVDLIVSSHLFLTWTANKILVLVIS